MFISNRQRVFEGGLPTFLPTHPPPPIVGGSFAFSTSADIACTPTRPLSPSRSMHLWCFLTTGLRWPSTEWTKIMKKIAWILVFKCFKVNGPPADNNPLLSRHGDLFFFFLFFLVFFFSLASLLISAPCIYIYIFPRLRSEVNSLTNVGSPSSPLLFLP